MVVLFPLVLWADFLPLLSMLLFPLLSPAVLLLLMGGFSLNDQTPTGF